MQKFRNLLLMIFFLSSSTCPAWVPVKGGFYIPIVGNGKKKFVPDFDVDEVPVTNEKFAAFLASHSQWRRGVAPALFVDSNYLAHWKSPLDIGNDVLRDSPVVNISWFAASAYCRTQKGALPTVDQWEYLAQFGPVGVDVNVESIILDWYSKPTPEVIGNVRSTFKNKFGVWDIHGLIWEWNDDFNTTFVTGESRGDAALEKSMFCGAGGASSVNPEKYSAFMRYGFRSSLQARYSVQNLGFRCLRRR